MIGAEITRITAPHETYGWLVSAGDIMLDLVVRERVVQRMDRSLGFASLHTNDLKRLAVLRLDDILRLLGRSRSEVTIEPIYMEIPECTYDMLVSDDLSSQHAGFNELMVWVGRELRS